LARYDDHPDLPTAHREPPAVALRGPEVRGQRDDRLVAEPSSAGGVEEVDVALIGDDEQRAAPGVDAGLRGVGQPFGPGLTGKGLPHGMRGPTLAQRAEERLPARVPLPTDPPADGGPAAPDAAPVPRRTTPRLRGGVTSHPRRNAVPRPRGGIAPYLRCSAASQLRSGTSSGVGDDAMLRLRRDASRRGRRRCLLGAVVGGAHRHSAAVHRRCGGAAFGRASIRIRCDPHLVGGRRANGRCAGRLGLDARVTGREGQAQDVGQHAAVAVGDRAAQRSDLRR